MNHVTSDAGVFSYDMCGQPREEVLGPLQFEAEPIERHVFWRCLDNVGYIPAVQVVVGLIRMIAGIIMGVVAGIGNYVTSSNKYDFTLSRAGHETWRGFEEALFVLLPFKICAKDSERDVKRGVEEGAYGRWMYQTTGPFLSRIVYSAEKNEGGLSVEQVAVEDPILSSVRVVGTFINPDHVGEDFN